MEFALTAWRIAIRRLMTPVETTIPKESSPMPRTKDRTSYCRQQAAECASAATTTTLSEIREAYLNIEQAWLQLAPDIDSNQAFSLKPEPDEQGREPSK
jgi:hypothetical protein